MQDIENMAESKPVLLDYGNEDIYESVVGWLKDRGIK